MPHGAPNTGPRLKADSNGKKCPWYRLGFQGRTSIGLNNLFGLGESTFLRLRQIYLGTKLQLIAREIFHPASKLTPPLLPERISKAICLAVQQLFSLELNLERSEVGFGLGIS